MKELILAYQGEMTLKGLNRGKFEARLAKTIRWRLEPLGKFKVYQAQSTVFIEPKEDGLDMDEAFRRVSHVFGIVKLSRAVECPKDFAAICETAEAYLGETLRGIRTFKVEAKRADKTYPMKSPEICRELGAYLLDKHHHLRVDVHNPQLEIMVEIRDYAAYVHGPKVEAAGGLPVGTSGRALNLLSGGIDSGVCAVLGNLAIGHKLHCIFIDTGLLRKNESEQVMAYYHDNLGLNLRRIDAREEFLTALAGVSDPAEKERIVTERLMSILSREAAAIDDIRLVIQGTNVTDTLYRPHTGSTIDGLPIIEPVRELFKDEIRQVGQELGMPAVLVNRQPFPGSGLASRIMADVTAERLDILREADDIFRHDVEDSNQNKRLWQYFAALALSPFPDGGYVVTLRAVQTAEGAAGNTARFTADLLERVTAHILAQCPKVQRVFYDLTPSKSYKRANL